MRNIILTIGMPGSGKSTWSKTFLSNNRGYCRVSRDDFRWMLWDVQFDPELEKEVTLASEATWQALLSAGKNILLDECHLGPWLDRKIRTVETYCNQEGIEYVISRKHFPCELEEIIARNLHRPAHQQVPGDVLLRMWENGGKDLWMTKGKSTKN